MMAGRVVPYGRDSSSLPSFLRIGAAIPSTFSFRFTSWVEASIEPSDGGGGEDRFFGLAELFAFRICRRLFKLKRTPKFECRQTLSPAGSQNISCSSRRAGHIIVIHHVFAHFVSCYNDLGASIIILEVPQSIIANTDSFAIGLLGGQRFLSPRPSAAAAKPSRCSLLLVCQVLSPQFLQRLQIVCHPESGLMNRLLMLLTLMELRSGWGWRVCFSGWNMDREKNI